MKVSIGTVGKQGAQEDMAKVCGQWLGRWVFKVYQQLRTVALEPLCSQYVAAGWPTANLMGEPLLTLCIQIVGNAFLFASGLWLFLFYQIPQGKDNCWYELFSLPKGTSRTLQVNG